VMEAPHAGVAAQETPARLTSRSVTTAGCVFAD
jgi:hypothetical protein